MMLCNNTSLFAPDDWSSIHSPLIEHRELQLGDSARIRPLGFVRLAWRDEVDDSPQFARAYLSTEYDADKKWPMVVYLHGYDPSETRQKRATGFPLQNLY